MKKWLCGLMSLALVLCIGGPGGGLSALAFAGDAAAMGDSAPLTPLLPSKQQA